MTFKCHHGVEENIIASMKNPMVLITFTYYVALSLPLVKNDHNRLVEGLLPYSKLKSQKLYVKSPLKNFVVIAFLGTLKATNLMMAIYGCHQSPYRILYDGCT